MKRSILPILTCFILIGINCGDEKPTEPPPPPEPPDYYSILAENINAFSWSLFENDLLYRATANIHNCGPALYRGLSWIYFGCDYASAEELKTALGLADYPDSILISNMRLLFDSLQRQDPNLNCSFNMAAFIRPEYSLDSEYQEIMNALFNFDIFEITYNDSLLDIRMREWMESVTNREFSVDSGAGSEIEIANFYTASYFYGSWGLQFDSTRNSFEVFHHPFENDTLVEMMHTIATFQYYEDSLIKFIDIPFGESGYSISLIIPVNPTWPMTDDILPSPDKYYHWINNSDTMNIHLTMPLINIYDIEDRSFTLQRMGVMQLFYPFMRWWFPFDNGQSYGIKEFTSAIKTKISNGGVTMATVKTNSDSDNDAINLTTNYPFSYVIRDDTTGVIIAIGRIIEL